MESPGHKCASPLHGGWDILGAQESQCAWSEKSGGTIHCQGGSRGSNLQLQPGPQQPFRIFLRVKRRCYPPRDPQPHILSLHSFPSMTGQQYSNPRRPHLYPFNTLSLLCLISSPPSLVRCSREEFPEPPTLPGPMVVVWWMQGR